MIRDGSAAEAARSAAGMSTDDLWTAYVALGGGLTAGELERFLGGGGPIDDYQYDMLVQAVNERYMDTDTWPPRPYADELSRVGDR